jgi:hypothetical protein
LAEDAPARDQDRQVLIRLDWAAYSRLAALAELEGVAATTKARMLLRKALREALEEWANGDRQGLPP